MSDAPIADFVAARKEWHYRYGVAIADANRWRLVSAVLALIAITSVGGNVAMSLQNKLVPYLVEVDRDSQVVNVKEIEQLGTIEPAILRSVLANWITDLRVVTADVALQRASLKRAYAFLAAGKQAIGRVNEWMKSNTPWERAKTQTVAVDVINVTQLTKDTWQLHWSETARDRKTGEVIDVVHWIGNATYVQGVVSQDTLLKNPFGVYIETFDPQLRNPR